MPEINEFNIIVVKITTLFHRLQVPIFIGFTDAFVNALKFKLKIEYYPKGSLVTRVGDLDYRMYIIVKGTVWVCDRDDRWLCTLSTGEYEKKSDIEKLYIIFLKCNIFIMKLNFTIDRLAK